MPWLRSADEAAMSLCRQYAATIDRATRSGDREAIMKSMYLGPHLSGLLSALGGTPAGRKSLPLAAPPSPALTALRASVRRPVADLGPVSGDNWPKERMTNDDDGFGGLEGLE